MRHQADIESLTRRFKIFAVVLCVLMARVWEHVQSQRLERRLQIMRTEADRLTYENGRLQMQIHQYAAPSHLEALAKNELAMIPLEASHRVGIAP